MMVDMRDILVGDTVPDNVRRMIDNMIDNVMNVPEE